MKTTVRNAVLYAGAAVIAALLVWALIPAGDRIGEPEPNRGGVEREGVPGRDFSSAELAALEGFLTMSDEQLDRVQDVIERIRVMSEEERSAFAAEVVEYRRLPREERVRIRDGWGRRTTDEDREDWRRMMRTLTPEERRETHESLQGLSGDDRLERRLEILEAWREEG